MASSTDDAPEAANFNNLKLDVTFRFDSEWHIGRVGKQADDASEARLHFPAGGGLRAGSGIVIAPLDLQGLSPDEVAKAVRHRAEDMAMLAEAITIANIQFREALDRIAPSTVGADA